MSMSKSRIVWLAALAVVFMPLLAACGGEAATPTAVPAAPTETTAATAAATAAAATDTPAPAAMTSPTVPPTVLAGGQGCASSATKLTWYVGLGAGGDPDVIPKEKDWVDKFNKSQTDACLTLQVVHNPESYDTLKAQ